MINYKKKTISWMVAAVILLIFFHYLGLTSAVERLAVNSFSPISKVFYSWGITVNKFSHLGELIEENQKLQEELGKLSIDYVKLTSLEAENQYLTGELNFSKKTRYQFQLANVVGRLPLNDQILIIDRGKDQGLKPGLPATVAEGVI